MAARRRKKPKSKSAPKKRTHAVRRKAPTRSAVSPKRRSKTPQRKNATPVKRKASKRKATTGKRKASPGKKASSTPKRKASQRKKATSAKTPKKASKKGAAKTSPKRGSTSKKPAKRLAKGTAAKLRDAEKKVKSLREQIKRLKNPTKDQLDRARKAEAQAAKSPKRRTPAVVLADVKREVASQLHTLHGIDPELAPRVVQNFSDDIKELRDGGMSATDIAIVIARDLASEGRAFQETRAGKPPSGQIVEGVELLRAQLIEMRQKVIDEKYHKGYSPPSTEVWARLNEAAEVAGYTITVPVARVLSPESVNSIVAEAMMGASKVWSQHPEGLMYSAIEMYEWGHELVGSAKFTVYSAGTAQLNYSYSGTKGVPGDQFERVLRNRLRRLALVANAATFVESISIKTYDKKPK